MDICLELFNCLSGEQTVAMRKTKFLKTVSNSSNMLCRTFAVEASKRTGDLIKSCHISYVIVVKLFLLLLLPALVNYIN